MTAVIGNLTMGNRALSDSPPPVPKLHLKLESQTKFPGSSSAPENMDDASASSPSLTMAPIAVINAFVTDAEADAEEVVTEIIMAATDELEIPTTTVEGDLPSLDGSLGQDAHVEVSKPVSDSLKEQDEIPASEEEIISTIFQPAVPFSKLKLFPTPSSVAVPPTSFSHESETVSSPLCKSYGHEKSRDLHSQELLDLETYATQLGPGLRICKSYLLYHMSCGDVDCVYSHDLKAAGIPLIDAGLLFEIVNELRKIEGAPSTPRTRLKRLLASTPKKPDRLAGSLVEKNLLRKDPNAVVFSPLGPIICKDHLLDPKGCIAAYCAYSHDLSPLNLEARSRGNLLEFFDSINAYWGQKIVRKKLFNREFAALDNSEKHDFHGLNGAQILKIVKPVPQPSYVEPSNSTFIEEHARVKAAVALVIVGIVSGVLHGTLLTVILLGILFFLLLDIFRSQPFLKNENTQIPDIKTSKSPTPSQHVTKAKARIQPPPNTSQQQSHSLIISKEGSSQLAIRLAAAVKVPGLTGEKILEMIEFKRLKAKKAEKTPKPQKANNDLSIYEAKNAMVQSTTSSTPSQSSSRSSVRTAIIKKKGKGKETGKPAFAYRDGEVVGALAPEIGVENRGRAMLEKMGWSEGEALGVGDREERVLVPIMQRVKLGRQGLGTS